MIIINFLQDLISYIYNLLNTQFFTAIVTLLVGSFVIYLYTKQRSDHKRDAAALILQEIRYSEQLVRNSDHTRYSFGERLLPTNSWNESIHLFLNDLEENEIDSISRYYSNVAYMDILIKKISDGKSEEVRTKNPIIINQIQSPVQIPNPARQVVVEPVINDMLKEISLKVVPIYNTPIGTKLKNISKNKSLFL